MSSTPVRRGLTLLELLVTLTILALLAALLFPAFGAARRHGAESQCTSQLRQLGHAWQMYAADYDQAPPRWLWSLHPTYAQDARLFVCPADIAAPPGHAARWYGLGATAQPDIAESYLSWPELSRRRWQWIRHLPGRPGLAVCVVHGDVELRPTSGVHLYQGLVLRLCTDGSVARVHPHYSAPRRFDLIPALADAPALPAQWMEWL